MRYFFILIFVSLSYLLAAQSATEAENLFNSKQYFKARNIFESLLKRKPTDPLLNYKMGRCCYELKDFSSAIKYFENTNSKYPLKDWYLGDSYFKAYRFEMSISAYQAYMASLEPDDKKIAECEQLIKKAELGQKLINRIESITIVDSLVFNKPDFLNAYNFSSELGKLNQQRIRLNNRASQDKILFTTQREDRKIYSDSIKGNMDIFTSFKLLDEWSQPTSISKIINTSANENFPFLLLDGITLYFASDGENSLGGYDIFMSRYSSSTKDFLVPENVGFPFNSTANDYMMVIDEQHTTGWFATDRNQATGKVIVYKFEFQQPKQYFKSEDSVLLSNVAQLKTYKIIKTKKSTIENKKTDVKSISDVDVKIIINDSVVYSSSTQFKNSKALILYEESMAMKNELIILEKSLADLRWNYYKEEQTDEQKKLISQIIHLENSTLQLKKDIQQKSINATNAEIIFLQQK